MYALRRRSLRKNDFVKYDPETGMFDQEKTAERLLDTDGTNLIDILGHSMVDLIH